MNNIMKFGIEEARKTMNDNKGGPFGAVITDKDGNILGRNCKGDEKLKRLAAVIPNAQIVTSYSDSESDLPILEVAKTAYVVEGNKLIPYTRGYNFKNKN